MTCAVPNCNRPVHAHGWCHRCYKRWHRTVYQPPWMPPCTVTGCNTPAHARGLCNRHWWRYHRYGDTSPLMVDALPIRGLLGWLRDEGASDPWIANATGLGQGNVWSIRTGKRHRVLRRTADRIRQAAERVAAGELEVPGQADAQRRKHARHQRQEQRHTEAREAV